MSQSQGAKLAFRGHGSIGYFIEAVSVDQLSDVWHPMGRVGCVEVCTTHDILGTSQDTVAFHHDVTWPFNIQSIGALLSLQQDLGALQNICLTGWPWAIRPYLHTY